MNEKLLVCGSGLVLGVGVLLSLGLKDSPSTEFTNSKTASLRKGGLVAGQSAPSLRGHAPANDPRLALLERLHAAVSSNGAFDREKFSSLLAKLVAIDPSSAVEFATSITDGPMREEALRRVSQAWASKDPASAEKWATGLADESERQSALADICMQVARSNAGEAVGIAEKHNLGAGSESVTENLVHQWATQDYPAAATWIKARPPGEQRDQMMMRLALVRSATQPADAARLVVEEIPDGPVQTEAVISVIYQWAGRDMAGARAWARLFPEGALRDRAESELTHMAAFQPPGQP